MSEATETVFNSAIRGIAKPLLPRPTRRAYSDWLSNQPPLHWLQVNNLHFIKEPIRPLPEGPVPVLA